MALKKSELYSSLWASCDELRGGMDASQYKDYVLVLLFVKYVSDRFAGQPFAAITVPEGASFRDMVALKGAADIGDQINKKILGPLAQANNLSDMPDFNDPSKLGNGKEMVDRLTNLIGIFENPALDFSKNRADGDDLLGDAYEYLMRHFATESGKSKGQFYTPAEVSRVIANILGIRHASTTASTTVYDPTCGSGSLLLKVGDEAARGNNVQISLFGQEKDTSTAGLARMNMILHNYPTAEIKQGNTLANPLFTEGQALKTFDYVVANPPFSDKRWSTGIDPEHDLFQRFQDYGVPPAKQGDYAYLLHILRSLKQTGSGACILPHGVLFRGNAEAAIRRNLIQRGYIKAIIGLPANLFYGTGIPACILVLDKREAVSRKGIFMIDASKGFIKDGNKNRLREQDIHRIVDTFTRQLEVQGYSRMVPVAEISDAKNDYNLNLPRYIDGSDAEDLQDITAHLMGGIPERDLDAFDAYWQVMPSLRTALFKGTDRAGYAQLTVPIASVKAAIFDHAEFTAFNTNTTKLFDTWVERAKAKLTAFDQDQNPKELIETISEDLLNCFGPAKLISKYDVYQHLMDYWAETMQDDCYLIAADGWEAAAAPKLIVEEKGSKSKAKADFVVGKKKYQTELIPPSLIIARYFAAQQAKIDALADKIAGYDQQLEEMAEEHGGEDGLLEDAKNDKDKITKASVSARLKAIKQYKDAADERAALQAYLAIVDQQSDASDILKMAEAALMEKVAVQYQQLTKQDIIALVVDDKWIGAILATIQGELNSVFLNFVDDVSKNALRYSLPVQSIDDKIAQLKERNFLNLSIIGRAPENLLVGEKRVSGFTRAWQPRRLRDIGVTYGGLTGKGRSDFGVGSSFYVTFMNVMTNIVLDPHMVERVKVENNESQSTIRKHDLIFNGSSETADEVALCSIVPDGMSGLHLNSFCFGFRPFVDDIDSLFMAYFFRGPAGRELVKALAQGSTRINISKRSLLDAELSLPDKEEQIVIAKALADSDAEIKALHQRAEKSRLIKHGIMQDVFVNRGSHE